MVLKCINSDNEGWCSRIKVWMCYVNNSFKYTDLIKQAKV